MHQTTDDPGLFTAREWYEGFTLLVGVAAFVAYTAFFDIAGPSPAGRWVMALARSQTVRVSDYSWLVLRAALEGLFVGACGAILGRVGWRNWRRFTVCFAAGFVILPTLILAPTCTERRTTLSLVLWVQTLVVPFPCVLLAGWLVSRRIRQLMRCRDENGLCIRCGYNLTGNVSGVCPECGTAVANAGPEPKKS